VREEEEEVVSFTSREEITTDEVYIARHAKGDGSSS
jgi:hypothetical protein